MVITSLCDNLALPGFAAEHGLSLWIDTGKERILFDFGQTDAYEANAQKLGIHLAEADFGFLSHGHYDHGGGLARFLAANSHAPVYLSPYAFEDHRNRLGNYIGLAPMESPRLLTRGCRKTFAMSSICCWRTGAGASCFPAAPIRGYSTWWSIFARIYWWAASILCAGRAGSGWRTRRSGCFATPAAILPATAPARSNMRS